MGKPKICNPCCEGGAGISSSSSSRFAGSLNPNTCNPCYYGISPAQWTVTVSGVTAGTNCNSTYCTVANRTWTMSPQAACTWSEQMPATGLCFGLSNSMRAGLGISIVGGGGQLQLQFFRAAGVAIATYRVNYAAPSGVDCLVPHTLSLLSNGTECASWPATLIVSPA